jgi:YegS/Rv2252/BmrU family lipid kinase
MNRTDVRNILIIINPVAGKGRTIEIMPKIKEKLDPLKNEIEYKLILSNYAGEISEITKRHYDLGYREFIAVGGDGTLSELINGLDFAKLESVKIGIIPLGTGNDFVKNFSEKNDVNLVLDAVIHDQTKTVDMGIVNSHMFINVCSFGIDGPIIKDTEKYKKIFPGKFSYLFSTLKAGITFKPKKVKVQIDDQIYKGQMILVAVGNGKYFGGGMKVCPDALLTDGLFDICLVKDVSKAKFMKEISKVYSGRLGEVNEVTYSKGRFIRIEVEDGQYLINVDGNLVGTTPVEISIIENAVRVFV